MNPSSPDPTSPDEPKLRVEPFDPDVHVSPHALFRWLHDAAEGAAPAPVLIDLRAHGGRVRFRDVDPHPLGPPLPISGEGEVDENSLLSQPWERGSRGEGPREQAETVILLDADGTEATRRARGLRKDGYEWVLALYGGMDLYDYALDPQVVGAERFLAE